MENEQQPASTGQTSPGGIHSAGPGIPNTNQSPQQPTNEFKPNIYPIIYWALVYGVIAGLVMFVLTVLSKYITVIWFPVFLAGLVWGAFRNYGKQKDAWNANKGVPPTKRPVMEEFKDAVRDIAVASREIATQQEPSPSGEPEQRSTDTEDQQPKETE